MTAPTRIPQQKSSEQRARVRTRGGDSSDEDSRTLAKRARKTPSPTIPEPKLLACPYSKFDFARYSEANLEEKEYRRCSSHFLTDVPRLKQHLYRVHCRPKYHCRRCFEVFPSELSLNSHARRSARCQQRDCPFSERLTDTQVGALKRKWPGKSPSDCFYLVYKILFPDAPMPESPYANQHNATPTQKLWSPQMADSLGQMVIQRLSHPQNAASDASWLSTEAKLLISQAIKDSVQELLQQSTTVLSVSPSGDGKPAGAQWLSPREDGQLSQDEAQIILPSFSHSNDKDCDEPSQSFPEIHFDYEYLESSTFDLEWGSHLEMAQVGSSPQILGNVQQHDDHMLPNNVLYKPVVEEASGPSHLPHELDRTAIQRVTSAYPPARSRQALGSIAKKSTTQRKSALPTRTRLPVLSQQHHSSKPSYRDLSTPSDSGYSSTRTLSRASSRSSEASTRLAVRGYAAELCAAEGRACLDSITMNADDDEVWKLPDIHEEGFIEVVELLTSDWNDWHPTGDLGLDAAPG